MTKFGIAKENMFAFWDVSICIAVYMYIILIKSSLVSSSGLVVAIHSGLQLDFPLLSTLAWTTLNSC